MTVVLKKAKPFRTVMFTDEQLFVARNSHKFKNGHREFIAFLFRGQHKCLVSDFTKLRYEYQTLPDGTSMTKVTGFFGESIHTMG